LCVVLALISLLTSDPDCAVTITCLGLVKRNCKELKQGM
jgi:hypothetical protein